jgi:hypothetical protein
MARLTVKSSVRFKAFPPAMLRMLMGLYAVAASIDDVPELVITSANDSTHSPNSRHYRDEALDIRVHNFPTEAARRRLAATVRDVMGPQFTVLYEAAGTPQAHVHIQVKRAHTYTPDHGSFA